MALSINISVVKAVGPVVAFSATVTGGTYNSIAWNFGDQNTTGGGTANGQSVAWIYQATGSQVTVTATVTGTDGSTQTATTLLNVEQIGEGHPEVSFTWTANGNTVQFTDTSVASRDPLSDWLWVFGDGSWSQLQNPSNTYTASGNYNVTLAVRDYWGPSYATQPVGLEGGQTPGAEVSFSTEINGLTVQFADTSTTPFPPIGEWEWDFGDGSSATGSTAVHTYANPGTYPVTLTITDYHDATTGSPVNITVAQAAEPPPANPIANFSVQTSGLLAQFTDTSTDTNGTITSRLWNFGDGATSTAQNAQRIYTAAGTYTVTLTITDLGGTTATKSAQVTVGQIDNGDTLVIKGFMGYGALANNSPSQVATLGELSARSVTFALDRQLFGGSTGGSAPSSVDLTVFSSKKADGTQATVPSDYAAIVQSIGAWMYVNGLNGQFTADPNVFLQALTAEFGSQIKEIALGTMVTQAGLWWPDSLTFYFSAASATQPSFTTRTRVRLWFADATFQSQYDEFHLEFIPPLDNLDDFFKSADVIQAELAAVTLQQTLQKAAALAGTNPYTLFKSDSYNWIDPLDHTHYLPSNWTYLIWGAAGNNVDAIKTALQDYILDNSTHSRDEWTEIFPDIFQSTEFILTPMWTQYAIPNKTLDPSGMYQSVVNTAQALNIATETAAGTGYTAQHIANVLNVVPVAYKTLSMLAVGGPQNRNGINQFQTRWTDYLSLPTSSADFGRMQQNTQGFVRQLFDMLKVAETMTENSDIPTTMTRLHRTNANGESILFLAASYDSVQYLIVAKSWLTAKYGATTNTTAPIGIGYDGTYNNGAYQLLNEDAHMTLQFSAENATAPLTFEVVDGTMNAPSINPLTGLFQGNFETEGLYSLTLKLTDAKANSVTSTFAFRYAHPQTGSGPTS